MPSESDRWEAWDRFLESAPDTGFMQTSWWAEFRANSGYRCFAITLKEGDRIVGGAMVMKFRFAPGRSFYYISDGPVLPSDEADARQVFTAVLGVVERHRAGDETTVSHLRIEPRWRQLPAFVPGFEALAAPDAYAEPRHTLCIDLRPPPGEILAQMKPKGRYNVRLAQRHGVTVTEDTSARGLEDFLRIHGETAARKQLGAQSPEYFRRLLSILSVRRRVSLYFAEHRGERLATGLLVTLGRRATYFFGGSLARDRHVMAPYLLQFEMMLHARARGCECYDFWGVAPIGASDHAWQAISNFKRKFGGQEVSLVPTLDLVFDARAYAEYRCAAQHWSGRRIEAPGAQALRDTIAA